MTVDMVIDALGLPPESRVDQRLAKKLLVENGAPTAADKKAINDGIEELSWIAELKSSNCGVPVYKDEEREYIEVAVLALSFRNGTKIGDAKVGGASESRIIELVHRAIPYPVFLIARQADRVKLSLAHKKWAQNEGGKMILDVEPIVSTIDGQNDTDVFLTALSLGNQDRRNFLKLYESWAAQLLCYNAFLICGAFQTVSDSLDTGGYRRALAEHAQIERALVGLRASAKSEVQINRRVETNLEIKKLELGLRRIEAFLRADYGAKR